MALQSAQFQMADRLAGGDLAEKLVDLYRAGTSWEEATRRLYADYGIQVSGQTLRRWAKALDIEQVA